MICVPQTRLYYPDGNCYQACIASILECDLDLVPQHTAEEGIDGKSWTPYWVRLEAWLRGWNLCPQTIGARRWRPAGYTVLGGKAATDGCPHAVVAFDGEEVWDPHPNEPGIGAIAAWTIFTVLDPSRPIGPPKEKS